MKFRFFLSFSILDFVYYWMSQSLSGCSRKFNARDVRWWKRVESNKLKYRETAEISTWWWILQKQWRSLSFIAWGPSKKLRAWKIKKTLNTEGVPFYVAQQFNKTCWVHTIDIFHLKYPFSTPSGGHTTRPPLVRPLLTENRTDVPDYTASHSSKRLSSRLRTFAC
jgi:hypothetical protein